MQDKQHTLERKRLSVQGLTHSYGGNNAVSDVSFTIEPGEIVLQGTVLRFDNDTTLIGLPDRLTLPAVMPSRLNRFP
ncbi:hypothetical protein [Erwinia sp. MYb535]|uniref:hypothetical protein n=1 Tax=Erwinia sp. MYb535 TaxID=2745309 RepID=UPI0030AABF73